MKKEDIILYQIGWAVIGLIAVTMGISAIFKINLNNLTIPCFFHALTGLYCPGCGGTRAVKALIGGNVLLSLSYHPVVVYGVLVFGTFMFRNSIYYVSRKKIGVAMTYKNWYIYCGVILLILNCIIKNILILSK